MYFTLLKANLPLNLLCLFMNKHSLNVYVKHICHIELDKHDPNSNHLSTQKFVTFIVESIVFFATSQSGDLWRCSWGVSAGETTVLPVYDKVQLTLIYMIHDFLENT